MMGFKSFYSAARLIAGIELMHMIKKGKLCCSTGLVVSDADHFYSLATRRATPRSTLTPLDRLVATEPAFPSLLELHVMKPREAAQLIL